MILAAAATRAVSLLPVAATSARTLIALGENLRASSTTSSVDASAAANAVGAALPMRATSSSVILALLAAARAAFSVSDSFLRPDPARRPPRRSGRP
jgi:hypothetical protein